MVTGGRHRIVMALGLVLLAPTVGEFLLGNIAISQYGSVVVLAPLYGGGALLIREVARHLGTGWPSMVVLAAAYALVEEGPVDQMVFNPGYLGLGSFAGYAEIPGLGISGTLVLWSLALHTVWSICVPIALVEAFDPAPTEPWLGRVGLLCTGVVFVTACVLLGWSQAVELDFVGSPAQFLASGSVIVALVTIGLLVGRPRAPRLSGRPRAPSPAPLRVAVAAFLLTSAYWLGNDLPLGATGTVVAQVLGFVLAATLAVVVVGRWSRRSGWDGRHRLGLAAGATATYALWFGPSQAHEAGTGASETVVGSVVFGVGALVLVVVAAARQRRLGAPHRPEAGGPGPGRVQDLRDRAGTGDPDPSRGSARERR